MGRKNAAFTLVELMIVIAIIAVLTVLAIAYFRGQIFKGSDARRKADLNRISIAAEEYEKDHNCYPPSDIVVCTPADTGLQPYLSKIPCDPTTRKSYFYEPGPGACPFWYRVYTDLENGADTAIIPAIGPGGMYNYYVGSANAPVLVSSLKTAAPTPTAIPTQQPDTIRWGCVRGSCVPLVNPVCNPTFDNNNCNGNVCPQDPSSGLECH